VRIGQIVKTGAFSLDLTVQSIKTGEWWMISPKFEKTPPHRVTQLGIVDSRPPSVDVPGPDSSADLDAASRWGLPASETGLMSARLLEALDRLDESYTREFIKKNFSPKALGESPFEKQLEFFSKIQNTLGRIELLGAKKTGSYSAKLNIRSKKTGKEYSITLDLESERPNRILNLKIEENKQ
jgi:hypothetical protein